MTKQARDLKTGDDLTHWGEVIRVYRDRNDVALKINAAGGGTRWMEVPGVKRLEVTPKPRTVAAKDAEGKTVRLAPGFDSLLFKVEAVGLQRDGSTLMGGYWVDNDHPHWATRPADEQLEVVE